MTRGIAPAPAAALGFAPASLGSTSPALGLPTARGRRASRRLLPRQRLLSSVNLPLYPRNSFGFSGSSSLRRNPRRGLLLIDAASSYRRPQRSAGPCAGSPRQYSRALADAR